MSKKLLMNNGGVEISIYLVKGEAFNSTINQLKQRTTETIISIIFTKEKIPNEKISEGIDVSESTSEYKAYGYVDGNVIYISPGIKGGVLYANSDSSNMFYNQSGIKNIYFYNINTTLVVSMYNMFSGNSSLTTLDLSNFNTDVVEDMSGMFYNCSSLLSLNISNFNTFNVKNMRSMLNGCINLRDFDVSYIDTTNVDDTQRLFKLCYYLTGEITIRKSNISLYTEMFNNTSTNSSSKLIVKYVDSATKSMAQKLLTTKSSNSNVFLWEGEDI